MYIILLDPATGHVEYVCLSQEEVDTVLKTTNSKYDNPFVVKKVSTFRQMKAVMSEVRDAAIDAAMEKMEK